MGGSKGSKYLSLRNIFIIFLVSGFWHGANWTFIAWGSTCHFIYSTFLLGKNRKNITVVAESSNWPSFRELSQMLITFTLVTLAWTLFRASSISEACNFLIHLFTGSIITKPQMDIRVYLFIVLALIFLLIEWFGRREEFAIQRIFFSQPAWLRYGLYYGLVMAVFLFARKEQQFIYFQF